MWNTDAHIVKAMTERGQLRTRMKVPFPTHRCAMAKRAPATHTNWQLIRVSSWLPPPWQKHLNVLCTYESWRRHLWSDAIKKNLFRMGLSILCVFFRLSFLLFLLKKVKKKDQKISRVLDPLSSQSGEERIIRNEWSGWWVLRERENYNDNVKRSHSAIFKPSVFKPNQ